MFDDADVVSSYTRADALADGVLVDVGPMAREAGFKVPVAMTNAAWCECVAWGKEDKPGLGQSQEGRLWDVLFLAALAARKAQGNQAPFSVYCVPREGAGVAPEKVDLYLWIHPGDSGEPVCTILLEGED